MCRSHGTRTSETGTGQSEVDERNGVDGHRRVTLGCQSFGPELSDEQINQNLWGLLDMDNIPALPDMIVMWVRWNWVERRGVLVRVPLAVVGAWSPDMMVSRGWCEFYGGRGSGGRGAK